MSNYIDTYSVTDLRHKTNEILKLASAKGMVYLVRRSKTEAAIVDLDYLNALREAYEDYLDTLEFDKTIKLKKISLEKHKQSYRKTS
jgi:PHD/YefM family antitoxin component YafN of YafNO toxin-antitoxin module